ncbi:caspase family protein [Candidatus Pacearchaeota archaeon]|jgi:hypothetical protein|nr:caspase family protein [Candidatus Pacearchaeota archaeon]
MKKAFILAPPYQPPNTLPPHDNNVALWHATLLARGFTSIVAASTPEATTLAAARSGLQTLMSSLIKGDRWTIIRTGHGYRQPDQNGDELDGYDECLACSDLGMLTDDEMATYLAMAPAGTVGDLVDDFCYSGTADRAYMPSRSRPIRDRVIVGSGTKPAYYRYWQACEDHELSCWGYFDGAAYSVLTKCLCDTLTATQFVPATTIFQITKDRVMGLVAGQTPVLSGPNQDAVPF